MTKNSSGRKQVFDALLKQLSFTLEPSEARAIVRELFREVGITSTELSTRPEAEISRAELELMEGWTDRLVQGEPLQYVLGKTEFMGFVFHVASGVLIPRPETEELVDWVLNQESESQTLKVLDLGAGSGCIGLSIACLRPQWEVEVLENSQEALAILNQNRENLAPNVTIHVIDIRECTHYLPKSAYDVWISNPPYVLDSERVELSPQVRDYEPHAALFVPDTNPLYFYTYLAEAGLECLKPGGAIYLETHRDFAEDVAELLRNTGYIHVVTRKDLNENNRMVYGRIIS